MTIKNGRVIGPLGISYSDWIGAREVAVVSREVFGLAFNLARATDARIAEATSDFDHDLPETETIFRLSLDARSGYAVRENGELVYVFSLERGRGNYLVTKALEDGATHLDCFDGYLVDFYGSHGFDIVKRVPNWTPGCPDVVYMQQA